MAEMLCSSGHGFQTGKGLRNYRSMHCCRNVSYLRFIVLCHCNPCLCTQPWCGRLSAAFLVQGLQCLPCCCKLCYYTVTYACLFWIYFSAITCCAVCIMQGTLSHVLQSLGMHIAVAPSQPIFVMCLSLVLMAFQHHVVHLYCRRQRFMCCGVSQRI